MQSSTRLHAKTGAPPRSSTPTQKLSPMNQLLASWSDGEAEDNDVEIDNGISDGMPSVCSALGSGDVTTPLAALADIEAHHEAITMFERAERARTKGQLEHALQNFRAAVKLGHPEPDRCHAECGNCLEESDEWAAAVKEYSAAISLAPGDGMHRYSRGYALMRLGKFRSALDDAVVALQIDPEDRDAANLLAELHTSLSSGGTICDGGAFNRTAGSVSRISTAEVSKRMASLSGEQRDVIEDLGGLGGLAELILEDAGHEVVQAAAALLVAVYTQPDSSILAEDKDTTSLATKSDVSGPHGIRRENSSSSHQQIQKPTVRDPESQRWVEEARAREEKRAAAAAAGKKSKKKQEIEAYRQAAIARERARGSSRRPSPADDMAELVKLQRRAAKAMTTSISSSLAPPQPVETSAQAESSAETTLRKARSLLEQGPNPQPIGKDYRQQLSDAGQAVLGGGGRDLQDEKGDDPLNRARQLLSATNHHQSQQTCAKSNRDERQNEIHIGSSSSDEEVPTAETAMTKQQTVGEQMAVVEQLIAAGQIEAAHVLAETARSQAQSEEQWKDSRQKQTRFANAQKRDSGGLQAPLEALAAAQQETVGELAAAIRELLNRDANLGVDAEDEEQDWRAGLSDIGQSLLANSASPLQEPVSTDRKIQQTPLQMPVEKHSTGRKGRSHGPAHSIENAAPPNGMASVAGAKSAKMTAGNVGGQEVEAFAARLAAAKARAGAPADRKVQQTPLQMPVEKHSTGRKGRSHGPAHSIEKAASPNGMASVAGAKSAKMTAGNVGGQEVEAFAARLAAVEPDFRTAQPANVSKLRTQVESQFQFAEALVAQGELEAARLVIVAAQDLAARLPD